MNSLQHNESLYSSKTLDGEDSLSTNSADIEVLQGGVFTSTGTVTTTGLLPATASLSGGCMLGTYSNANQSDIVGILAASDSTGGLLVGPTNTNLVLGVRSNADTDVFGIVFTNNSSVFTVVPMKMTRLLVTVIAALCQGLLTTATLLVSGITTLQDTLSCTKATGTGLSVTANATVGGTLAVTSDATVGGTTTLEQVQLDQAGGSTVPLTSASTGVSNTMLGSWTSTVNSDVYTLLGSTGTAAGTAIVGQNNAPIVVALRNNDNTDAFSVMTCHNPSTQTNTVSSGLTLLAFQVPPDGGVFAQTDNLYNATAATYGTRTVAEYLTNRGAGANTADSGVGQAHVYRHGLVSGDRVCQFRTQSEATASAKMGLHWDVWNAALVTDAMVLDSGANLSIVGRYVDKSGGGVCPPGSIMAYGAGTAPTGWLLCDGSLKAVSNYGDLFAVIAYTYGTGSGGTQFRVPDMRGRVPIGLDNMGGTTAGRITAAGCGITGTTMGAAGGEETHVLTVAELAAHTHGISGNNITIGAGFREMGQNNAPDSGSAGGGLGHNNVLPGIVLTYIIST